MLVRAKDLHLRAKFQDGRVMEMHDFLPILTILIVIGLVIWARK
jgi:hypothetical protein